MNTREAIIAFSQSEKIKAGLIWVSQAIQSFQAGDTSDHPGAEKMITMFAEMIGTEIVVARRMAPDERWDKAQRDTDMAMVMIHSGVSPDAVFHLTRALTEVTGIAQQAMSFLKDRGLI